MDSKGVPAIGKLSTKDSGTKSSKQSQKKSAFNELVEHDINNKSSNSNQIYSSDEKTPREVSSRGAKVGKESKQTPALVDQVREYIEDDGQIPKTQTATSSVRSRVAEEVSDAPAATIGKGLRINSMTMRDANKNILLWAQNCRDENLFDGEEHVAHIPKEILQCSAVTRTINFSSFEKITSFSLIQKVILHGSCIEEWSYQFGFVIPGSTNNWEQTIFAAPSKEMIPADILSGNLVVETFFKNKDEVVARTSVRIFYDD